MRSHLCVTRGPVSLALTPSFSSFPRAPRARRICVQSQSRWRTTPTCCSLAARTSSTTSARTRQPRSLCSTASSRVPGPRAPHFRSRADPPPLPRRPRGQVHWNEAWPHYSRKAPKRAYYLCPRFLSPSWASRSTMPSSTSPSSGSTRMRWASRLGASSGRNATRASSTASWAASRRANWTRARPRSSRCRTTGCAASAVHCVPSRCVCTGTPTHARAHLNAPDGSQLKAPGLWLQHDNPRVVPPL